jgi:hypothetical protein
MASANLTQSAYTHRVIRVQVLALNGTKPKLRLLASGLLSLNSKLALN